MMEKVFNLQGAYKILVFLTVSFLSFIIVMFIFIFIGFIPNGRFDSITKLIPAIGIMLSALLASVSVLKNIENTNRIEKEKEEKQKKQFQNKLKIYLSEIESFIVFYKEISSSFNKFSDNEKDKSFLINQNNLNHSRNLIIKDINFFENIQDDEYKIIRLMNIIEIYLNFFSKSKYNEETHKKIDECVDSLEKLINEIKEKNI